MYFSRGKKREKDETIHSSDIGCVLLEPFFFFFLFVWAKIYNWILLILLMEAATLKTKEYTFETIRIQPLKQPIRNVL